MDVFGAGLDTPRGKGVRRQSGLEPFGKGLWVGKVPLRTATGHGGNFEKATRAQRERDEIGSGEKRSGG